MKKGYLVVLFGMLLMGCQEAKDVTPKIDKENEIMVGGACSYTAYTSKVKIVSIEEKSSKEKCQKSVHVKYELIEKAKELPLSPNGALDLRVSKAYMVSQGFDIGTIHTMKSSVIKSGTCTPMIESLVGIDESQFQKECKDK